MKNDPEIVRILRLQENLGVLREEPSFNKYDDLKFLEDSSGDAFGKTILFDEDYERDEIEIEEVHKNRLMPTGANNASESSFQDTNDIIIYLNGSGKIVKINKAGLAFANLSEIEIVGKIFWELPGTFSKIPVSDFRNLFNNAVDGKENQKLLCEIVDKSQNKHAMKFSMYPIAEDSIVKYVIVVFQDVTSENITKIILYETKEKLRALSDYFEAITESTITFGVRDLFSNVSDIIFQITPAGHITYINSAVEKIMGCKSEELIGDSFAKIIPNKIWKKEWKKAISEAENLSINEELNGFETYVTHKDGRIIPVEVNGKLIRHGLEVVGKENPPSIQGSIKDITERREAQEKLRKNAEQLKVMNEELATANEQLTSMNEELNGAHKQLTTLNEVLEQKVVERTAEVEKLLKHKDEFIAQLSHDLKSPLTPLVGLLPMVEQQVNDPKVKELLVIISRNVRYIKDLVVKTLQLERLNSPNLVFQINDVALLEATDSIIQNKEHIFKENNITIENNIDKKIFVKADSLHLGELFDNIFTNAVKFTPKGGKIIIDAEANKDFVTVSIKDTGIGLTKEQMERIFDEFYKVDPARHDLESSGLGLSICKRIAEKHGGKIWVESPGLEKGSTFYFTIPSASKKWFI